MCSAIAKGRPAWRRLGRGAGSSRGSARGIALSIVLAVICCLLTSCSPSTVWKAELPSPDGRYVAVARTLQQGGPGNNWIVTSVSLEQARIPQTRTEVLSFSCKGQFQNLIPWITRPTPGGR